MAKVVSLASQIRTMRERWPSFTAERGAAPKSVRWEGVLTGVEQAFTVSISYGLPVLWHDDFYREMPVVQVLEPRLRPNPDARDEAPLPHVYPYPPDPPSSPLCLFDPRKGEWHARMLIAKTTVPWAIRWLWYYELWDATGEWHGGGEHALPAEEKIHA